jgi:hypothetical protein
MSIILILIVIGILVYLIKKIKKNNSPVSAETIFNEGKIQINNLIEKI